MKNEYEASKKHLGGGDGHKKDGEHKKDGKKDGKDGEHHKIEIRVRPGHSHGFIAAHHKIEDGITHPQPHEEHPLPDKAAMMAHMDEHAQEQGGEEQAEGGGGEPEEGAEEGAPQQA
jgi:hypothetical protein